MDIRWNKSEKGKYTFVVDGKEKGALKLHWKVSVQSAEGVFGAHAFTIRRTGFWKSRIEITDRHGIPVAKVQRTKGSGRGSTLSYHGTHYRLMLRNNPLAEYVIERDGREVLAYGLVAHKGKFALKITGQVDEKDYLLHGLLWFLIWPHVNKSTDEDLVFMLLSGA